MEKREHQNPAGVTPLLVVAGPTASGKTALAISLAQRFDGEVVSADSMQVYAGLPVGTACPSAEETRGIPHHLQGILPLSERYSVARYAADARRAIAEIAARGRLPVLCGGTGLYIDAVVDNLEFQGEGGDETLRHALRRRAETEGSEALLAELRAVDPETAARLHPRNLGRIIRALELAASGLTMTEQNRRSRLRPSPYRSLVLVLDCHRREILYGRINRRVDAMLEAGLEAEARAVLSIPDAPTAGQAIGYKELAPYLRGEIGREEAAENLKRATRRYAKRQGSWFRRRPDAVRLYIDDYTTPEELAAAAAARVEEEGLWTALPSGR